MKKERMLIYLASPYTDPNPEIRQARNEVTISVTRDLILAGYMVISPIVASHPLAVEGGLPGDFEFWRNWNMAILERCDLLWILPIVGWTRSAGIKEEVARARQLGLTIQILDHFTSSGAPIFRAWDMTERDLARLE